MVIHSFERICFSLYIPPFKTIKPIFAMSHADKVSSQPAVTVSFEYALSKTKMKPDEVVHIGDSLGSDIDGANAVGIKAVWINRSNRAVFEGIIAVNKLTDVFSLPFFKNNL